MRLERLTTVKVFSLTISVILISAIYGGYLFDGVDVGFGESGLATTYSVCILALTAIASFKIYRFRARAHSDKAMAGRSVWLVISLGFLFLALDEELKIHEKTDKYIHRFFEMTETPLTDRIDDFIILAYGIIGALILYRNRDEILRIPGFFHFLKLGFCLMLLQVAIDVFTNGQDFIGWFSVPQEYADTVVAWGRVIEESVKLLAVAALFSGMIHALRYVSGNDLGPQNVLKSTIT